MDQVLSVILKLLCAVGGTLLTLLGCLGIVVCVCLIKAFASAEWSTEVNDKLKKKRGDDNDQD